MNAIAWRWAIGTDWFLAADMAEVKAAQDYLFWDLEYNKIKDQSVEVVTMPITVPEKTARILASKANGSVKSEAKSASSRENGKKGGRPKKPSC